MAQYHVGCGLAGIYAGTLKKCGDEWLNKSDVTDEAINAVVNYMYNQIPDGKNSFAYGYKAKNGKYIKLVIVSYDECPEWAKGLFDDKRQEQSENGTLSSRDGNNN